MTHINIDLVTEGNNRLIIEDDGAGMSRWTVLNKLVPMGSSTKRDDLEILDVSEKIDSNKTISHTLDRVNMYLADAIYKDPFAAVREILQNAEDTVLELNESTGGFGVGVNAIFLISDLTYITTVKDGAETTVVFRREGDKLTITVLETAETKKPNGTKVDVHVNNAYIKKCKIDLARALFSIRAPFTVKEDGIDITGKFPNLPKPFENGHGITPFQRSDLFLENTPIILTDGARYGDIMVARVGCCTLDISNIDAYIPGTISKIGEVELIRGIKYSQALKLISRALAIETQNKALTDSLALELPPAEISLPVSRDSIKWDTKTIVYVRKTINKLIQKVLVRIIGRVSELQKKSASDKFPALRKSPSDLSIWRMFKWVIPAPDDPTIPSRLSQINWVDLDETMTLGELVKRKATKGRNIRLGRIKNPISMDKILSLTEDDIILYDGPSVRQTELHERVTPATKGVIVSERPYVKCLKGKKFLIQNTPGSFEALEWFGLNPEKIQKFEMEEKTKKKQSNTKRSRIVGRFNGNSLNTQIVTARKIAKWKESGDTKVFVAPEVNDSDYKDAYIKTTERIRELTGTNIIFVCEDNIDVFDEPTRELFDGIIPQAKLFPIGYGRQRVRSFGNELFKKIIMQDESLSYIYNEVKNTSGIRQSIRTLENLLKLGLPDGMNKKLARVKQILNNRFEKTLGNIKNKLPGCTEDDALDIERDLIHSITIDNPSGETELHKRIFKIITKCVSPISIQEIMYATDGLQSNIGERILDQSYGDQLKSKIEAEKLKARLKEAEVRQKRITEKYERIIKRLEDKIERAGIQPYALSEDDSKKSRTGRR